MLLVVVRMAKFDQLRSVFERIPLSLLFIVVLAYALGQLLSSYKWCLIVRSAGVSASYKAALRAYFIGMYLNCFGLGTIGGDVARGLLIGAEENKKAIAVASVVADRLHGLAVLSGIGAIAAFCFGVQSLDAWLVLVLISLGFGIVLGWAFVPPLLLRLLPTDNRLRAQIALLVGAFPRTPQVLVRITLISAFFHLLQISIHLVMALAVGVSVPWSLLLVTVPFINILATLPVSWNGLGVRERAYVFFLVPAVLQAEHAVAFGAMWLLAVTSCSAIGGIVAVLTKDFTSIKIAGTTEDARIAQVRDPTP
ncbi:MAG: UPF0104 family protein [Proteobacteria bacterium]|nr:UPF0104 family protein [Pseudomonadota bacterium]